MAENNPLRCAYCLKEAEDLHRDHVVPRLRGGSDNATNIVMACQPCNSAKHDNLPSEWLGDRCPPAILMIEIREHNRLKKDFGGKRDRKGKPADEPPGLFAFSLNVAGEVEYLGEVRSEDVATVRIEAYDALNFWCGIWDLSGALYDVPRERCRIFTDRDSMTRKFVELYRQWEHKRPKASR